MIKENPWDKTTVTADETACLQCNRSVAVMEMEMKKLQDTADLFEVSFPEYKQLRQCRSDIILVKAVWDMIIFVKVDMLQTLSSLWAQSNFLWLSQ